MSFFSSIGKILGVAAAPFTGGASLLPSIISGGASILGGVLQNNSAKSLAQSSNAQAMDLANTAHQREVLDLQKAGLNPILSARGSGASSPVIQTPSVGNILGSAVSSALSANLQRAQIEQVKSQTEQTRANTDLTKQQLKDLQSYGAPAGSGLLASGIGVLRRGVEHLPPASELAARAADSFSAAGFRRTLGLGPNVTFGDVVREVTSQAEKGLSSARSIVSGDFLRMLERLKNGRN